MIPATSIMGHHYKDGSVLFSRETLQEEVKIKKVLIDHEKLIMEKRFMVWKCS